MLDVVDRARFVEEAANHVGVAAELCMQDLERDLLADLGMFGEVHRSHATFTQLMGDLVVTDGLPQ